MADFTLNPRQRLSEVFKKTDVVFIGVNVDVLGANSDRQAVALSTKAAIDERNLENIFFQRAPKNLFRRCCLKVFCFLLKSIISSE